MYELTYRTRFAAGHHLKGYHGKCEQPHGHNWDVIVTIEQKRLNQSGMIMDFNDLKREVEETLVSFDHKYLNDLRLFKGKNGLNPTTEILARLTYQKLQKRLGRNALRIKQVSVWESPDCGATYSEH